MNLLKIWDKSSPPPRGSMNALQVGSKQETSLQAHNKQQQ